MDRIHEWKHKTGRYIYKAPNHSSGFVAFRGNKKYTVSVYKIPLKRV